MNDAENPYASPAAVELGTADDFQDEILIARFQVEKKRLRQAAMDYANANGGLGDWITGGLFFLCVVVGVVLGSRVRQHESLVISFWVGAILAIVIASVVRWLRCRQFLKEMEQSLGIRGGQTVALAIEPNRVVVAVEGAHHSWPMDRVAVFAKAPSLSIVKSQYTVIISPSVVLPLPRNTDCGEVSLQTFIEVLHRRVLQRHPTAIMRLGRWLGRLVSQGSR